MKQSISDHFSTSALLHFALPTILVMVFTSVYGVVDGFFLSNYAGKTVFAAVNFIMPFVMILSSIGFMMGTGASALIGRSIGERQFDRARRQFTFLAVATFGIGILSALFGWAVLRPLLGAMGCTESMFPFAYRYGSILLLFLPAYMIQMYFQSVFVSAARPGTSFAVTLLGGLTNMVLDYLFIGVFSWGEAGAALATGIGQLLAALASVLCFLIHVDRSRESALYYTTFRFSWRDLSQTMSNGMSEFFSNSASAIISILYNMQLMRYIGEEGVAAYGTIMYVSMIFMAMSIGYTMGVAPLISCQYGAGNRTELTSLTKKSLVIIALSSVAIFLIAEGMGQPLSGLFAGYDANLYSITLNAFRVCSLVYLFSGLAIFGSGFFTALNNGPVSALISVVRTLVFQVGFILLFPLLWGVDGIWFSISAAEAMAVLVTVFLLIHYRKRYGYFQGGPNWKAA